MNMGVSLRFRLADYANVVRSAVGRIISEVSHSSGNLNVFLLLFSFILHFLLVVVHYESGNITIIALQLL